MVVCSYCTFCNKIKVHSYTWQPELTSNDESLGCCLCASCSQTTALHHCPIELSSGSEPEGGRQVCYITHAISDICEGGQIVKVSTLYGWCITATPTFTRGWSILKPQKSTVHKDWISSPTDNGSLDHSAGVGHHLPRTGNLPPIHSGGQGDGGYKWIVDKLIVTLTILVLLCIEEAQY